MFIGSLASGTWNRFDIVRDCNRPERPFNMLRSDGHMRLAGRAVTVLSVTFLICTSLASALGNNSASLSLLDQFKNPPTESRKSSQRRSINRSRGRYSCGSHLVE